MKYIAFGLGMILSIFLSTVPGSAETLEISSFNIQILGRSKMSKAEVVNQLTRILNRNHLTFIQEIRDSSEEAIYELLASTNAKNSHQYEISLSPPLGRTRSKEQYAYLYDDRSLRLVHSSVYYDKDDEFEREPYLAVWESTNGYRFATIGLHARPSDVEAELAALSKVVDYVQDFLGIENILIMGDLNADCDYYNPRKLGFQYIDSRISVWINDDQDTTVSATHCAYDRFMSLGSISSRIQNSGIFNYQQAYRLSTEFAKQVSDHFPIELSIVVPEDPHTDTWEPPLSVPAPAEPIASESTVPKSSCGINTYITPRGYCYASKGSERLRVSSSCCNL